MKPFGFERLVEKIHFLTFSLDSSEFSMEAKRINCSSIVILTNLISPSPRSANQFNPDISLAGACDAGMAWLVDARSATESEDQKFKKILFPIE